MLAVYMGFAMTLYLLPRVDRLANLRPRKPLKPLALVATPIHCRRYPAHGTYPQSRQLCPRAILPQRGGPKLPR